jgi:DNA-binding PadR family transcriptional regulator
LCQLRDVDRLTDFEGAALAEIARRGSATCYEVGSAFSGSPSEYWSGSAGAVYPMVRRLAKNGYVEARANTTGRRQKQDYSITAAGRAALENWLLDSERASGMGFDPLRTRLLYLDLVSPGQRADFIAAVAKHDGGEIDPPIFGGRDDALKIHRSWWQARMVWLSLIQEWEREKQ